jgi:hypothetical protein
MGATAFWEKLRPMIRNEALEQENWFAEWTARVKTVVAEIAATKSSQRLGREEEKE